MYIQDINLLQMQSLHMQSLPSCWIHSLHGLLCSAETLTVVTVTSWSPFVFVSCALPEKVVPRAASRSFPPFPHWCTASVLVFESLPLSSWFLYLWCGRIQSHYFCMLPSSFPSSILEEIAFSLLCVPGNFVSSQDCKLMGLFLGFPFCSICLHPYFYASIFLPWLL